MRGFLSIKIVTVIALTVISTFYCPAVAESGFVSLIINDPYPTPEVGEVFETKIDFVTSDVVLGAYLITVSYDPEKLRILEITTPSESEFYGSTYFDQNSFESGLTDISAFQTENYSEQTSPATLFTIQ